MTSEPLPVAVIGAGPVGLAAAAHFVHRGEVPIVLEAGAQIGAAVRRWAHVRVFSPWRYNVDPTAATMLTKAGWTMPDPEHLPTGRELVEEYLEPLAALAEIQPSLRLGTRVLGVSRRGVDKLRTDGREAAPFVLRVLTSAGEEQEIVARAVIDASGTSGSPNPLGADGTVPPGEPAVRDRLFYGIPDVLRMHRHRYAGRRVAVVGSGHSALNTLLDLAELADTESGTRITWIVRRPLAARVFGGGARTLCRPGVPWACRRANSSIGGRSRSSWAGSRTSAARRVAWRSSTRPARRSPWSTRWWLSPGCDRT